MNVDGGVWAFLGVFVTQGVIVFGLILNRRDTKATAKEVTHNGGSSMKDAVVRIEKKFDAFANESRTDRAHIWRTLTEHGIAPVEELV